MRLQLARGRAFDALGRKKTNWKTEKDRLGDRGQEIQESKGGGEGLGELRDSEG